MEEEDKIHADDDNNGVDSKPQAAISAISLSVSQTKGEYTMRAIDAIV